MPHLEEGWEKLYIYISKDTLKVYMVLNLVMKSNLRYICSYRLVKDTTQITIKIKNKVTKGIPFKYSFLFSFTGYFIGNLRYYI